MTAPRFQSHQFPHLPPEDESAPSACAASGTCPDGDMGAPSGSLSIEQPLTAPRAAHRSAEERARSHLVRRRIGEWAGDIVGALCLFLIFYVLFFIGGILQ